jgi:hypothetical protein
MGLNQYVFCANNPVNFTDAFGLCKDDDTEIGTAVPGKRFPPKDWPDPGKKWKWDKESGRYKKGPKYRHWDTTEGHRPHWDQEDKKGNRHDNIYDMGPVVLVGGIIIGGGVIIGTIIEDVFTGGVGLVDDPVTIGIGIGIIRGGFQYVH